MWNGAARYRAKRTIVEGGFSFRNTTDSQSVSPAENQLCMRARKRRQVQNHRPSPSVLTRYERPIALRHDNVAARLLTPLKFKTIFHLKVNTGLNRAIHNMFNKISLGEERSPSKSLRSREPDSAQEIQRSPLPADFPLREACTPSNTSDTAWPRQPCCLPGSIARCHTVENAPVLRNEALALGDLLPRHCRRE